MKYDVYDASGEKRFATWYLSSAHTLELANEFERRSILLPLPLPLCRFLGMVEPARRDFSSSSSFSFCRVNHQRERVAHRLYLVRSIAHDKTRSYSRLMHPNAVIRRMGQLYDTVYRMLEASRVVPGRT